MVSRLLYSIVKMQGYRYKYISINRKREGENVVEKGEKGK
jgi:hypothetical protein